MKQAAIAPLAPHMRPVTSAQIARLERYANRVPRFALMGEFSAGKSTMLNLLLDRDLVPTQVTATQLPAVWFRKGDSARRTLFDYEGNKYRTQDSTDDPISLTDCAMMRIELNDPSLDTFEVIDTPGISDPLMMRNALPQIARYCDFVIWCTPAVQAWRQSEVSMWRDLPDRLRAQSILAITGIDRLNARDQAKVASRIQQDTKGLFRTTIMIATPKASEALSLENRDAGAALWDSSGGAALMSEIDTSIEGSKAQRAALLPRYTLDEINNNVAAKPKNSTVKPAAHHAQNQNAAALWDQLASNAGDTTSLQAAITEFRALWPVNETLNALLDLPRQIDDLDQLKRQLRGEIDAFSKDNWRILVPK